MLSPTTAQAKVVFNYCHGFIQQSPVWVGRLPAPDRKRDFRLHNGIHISATHPNSFRSIRGPNADRLHLRQSPSFWRDETTALPDVECYRAVLLSDPTSHGMLIGISSPYRKPRMLYQRHIGDTTALTISTCSSCRATARSSIQRSRGFDRQGHVRDPRPALAEWAGQFRADIAAFLSDADITPAIIMTGPIELPPVTASPIRLSSTQAVDVMASPPVAIGHKDSDRTVIDVLRGQLPPFDR